MNRMSNKIFLTNQDLTPTQSIYIKITMYYGHLIAFAIFRSNRSSYHKKALGWGHT